MNKYIDDSFALHTDLSQIYMAEAYWEDNIHTKKSWIRIVFSKITIWKRVCKLCWIGTNH